MANGKGWEKANYISDFFLKIGNGVYGWFGGGNDKYNEGLIAGLQYGLTNNNSGNNYQQQPQSTSIGIGTIIGIGLALVFLVIVIMLIVSISKESKNKK